MTRTTKNINGIWGAAIVAMGLMVTFFAASHTEALVQVTLSPGSSGSQVTELQSFLATDASVYPSGLITGFYGELTTAAVQKFQCKNGIVCSGAVDSTGYGRVGPVTLSKIQSLSTPGVPDTGGAPASSVDDAAPIQTAPLVTVASTTANFQWATNEPAEHSVMYGSVWPFYLGTAASGWSKSFSTYANVTLTNLLPNHTYYYVRQSVDIYGNVQYGYGGVFTTSR